MTKSKICLVGEIVIDVTKATSHNKTKMRLGGIVHAARGLWAQNIPFSVAYFAPSYLDEHIKEYLTLHGCQGLIKLGDVVGAPAVFLIEEAKEVGNQGYEFLLRDELRIISNNDALNNLAQQSYDDIIIISGNFDLAGVINKLNTQIHVDLANNVTDFSVLTLIGKTVETLFLSTSSPIFANFYQNDFTAYSESFRQHANTLVLKENRGGSRAYSFIAQEFVQVPSQPRNIIHSVGVGDVYDATYACHKKDGKDFQSALTLASWMAAEYACTTYPDDLKRNMQRVLRTPLNELVKMPGISLPWEQRKNIHVYLAAPDFSFVDTRQIDVIESALIYHNFTPRRPIKENGEMERDASKERRQELFSKDMKMLSECQLLIAILLFNDPGTLIEIGLAATKGLPAMVYDPNGIASNCMLTELPTLVTSDPDELITQVFYEASKLPLL